MSTARDDVDRDEVQRAYEATHAAQQRLNRTPGFLEMLRDRIARLNASPAAEPMTGEEFLAATALPEE